MILPMMGLLFSLFVIGIIGGVISLLLPPCRRFAPLVFLVPIFTSVAAFCCSCGLAIGLEKIFQSTAAGGIGFFGGYSLGGLVGGGLGLVLALRRIRSGKRAEPHDNV